jgi:hypothetical protein
MYLLKINFLASIAFIVVNLAFLSELTKKCGSVYLGLLPESLFISSYFKVLIPEFKRKIERAKGINAFSNPQ